MTKKNPDKLVKTQETLEKQMLHIILKGKKVNERKKTWVIINEMEGSHQDTRYKDLEAVGPKQK